MIIFIINIISLAAGEARDGDQGSPALGAGANSGWSVESIQIDPPKEREVLVKLAASGGCHSDQHLDDGVIPLPWAPVLGGHEGAGVVTEIGSGVTDVAVGDHVVLSFLPSCTVVVVGHRRGRHQRGPGHQAQRRPSHHRGGSGAVQTGRRAQVEPFQLCFSSQLE